MVSLVSVSGCVADAFVRDRAAAPGRPLLRTNMTAGGW